MPVLPALISLSFNDILFTFADVMLDWYLPLLAQVRSV